jgi:drug/metabolite transporter (DMT)-like permease
MRDTLLKLHLSVFIAGFTGILGKLITLNEGLLVWYRLLIATAVMVFIPSAKRVGMRAALGMMGTGALLALHWVFFFGSIKASNVSISVVAFSMTGFFTAVCEPALTGRRVKVREILYSLIAVAGILLVFSFDIRHRTGILLGIVSALLAALFAIANKRIGGEDCSARTTVFYEMIGGLICISMLLPSYLHWFPSPAIAPSISDVVYLLIFSVICTVGLYLLQIEVLKKISAFTLNLSYNLEPVYSIILAMIIFGEARELNFAFYGGLALIVLSVFLQTMEAVRGAKWFRQL